ncbi:hypothetical protein PFISCL1PPCAC_14111, partial [Pristionchus fissidentatus]
IDSVLRISQIAVPHLEKTKGAIVNVSSIAKSALDQITVQMAGSLAKKGIRVNSVKHRQGMKKLVLSSSPPYRRASHVLAGYKCCVCKVVFQIILFLADRSQSEILVGHIVTADGGLTLKGVL